MSTQYTLNVTNNSTQSGSVVVYQKCPNQDQYDNLYSLAWFSKACHPGTNLKFRWTIDYSFAWSETGILSPGVYFDASEIKECDPSDTSKNTTGFSKQNGAYLFTAATKSANAGSLAIFTDATIPDGEASIGIGMSGNPTFAIPATPNFNFSFLPHPEYWVAFGRYEEGVVIDLNAVSETMKVAYPINVYSKSLTFNEDNTWSESTTLKASNARLLAAMKK